VRSRNSLRSDPLRLVIGGLPRSQLPLHFSTVQADFAKQVVPGEVQQMQVLLDGQGDGPVWADNSRHRDFDAAVITPHRGVLISRHGSSSPVVLRSGPRTLAQFTAILARITGPPQLRACISGGPAAETVSTISASSYRNMHKDLAYTLADIDSGVPDSVIKAISDIDGMLMVRYLPLTN
jgi:hypothetical protein